MSDTTTTTASTETTTTSTAATTTVTGALTWFEIGTTDPDRAAAFYGGLFGWPTESFAPAYDVFGVPEGTVAGGLRKDAGRSYAIACIQVPDVADACRRAVELGGALVEGPVHVPNGMVWAQVTDPDGSLIGLWTPPPAA